MSDYKPSDLSLGVVRPVVRSLSSVALLVIVGLVVTLRTGNGNWFFIIMFGGAFLHWLLDKYVFADRKRREKEASERFFGLRKN